MGVLPKGGRGRTYYNVSKGVLKHKTPDGEIEEHGGYSGIITGVRTVEGTWEGDPTCKLEIRMADAITGEEAIVSGGFLMWSHGRWASVSTWARMLAAALLNPMNDIRPDEELELGIYQFGKATCCSIRRAGRDVTLKTGGVPDAEDVDRMRNAVQLLIGKYGTFGKEQDDPREMSAAEAFPEIPIPDDDFGAPPPEGKDDLPF